MPTVALKSEVVVTVNDGKVRPADTVSVIPCEAVAGVVAESLTMTTMLNEP